ncbi:hypothetical protein KKA09_03430 [Patescibacteria group bacterium]|nr:hypothetical protein [Patescibacteria group bacterium]
MKKTKKIISFILLSSFFAFFSFAVFSKDANLHHNLALLNGPANKEVNEIGSETKEESSGRVKINVAENTESKPVAQFVSLGQGEVIEGERAINLNVKGADGVEFYLKKNQSSTSIYLGKGIKAGDNVWTLSFDSKIIPNGSYYLYSEITNQSGKYEGGEMLIEIKNQQEKEINKQEAIKKDIEKEKEINVLQEKEIKGKQEEIKKNVLEEVKALIEEKKAVNVFQIIESGIEELASKGKEEAVGQIDLTKKQEEKEKIENTLNSLKKEVAEISKNKPGVQFLEAFNFVKQDKEKNIKEKEEKLKIIKGEIELASEKLGGIRTEKKQIKQQIKEEMDRAVGSMIKEKPETEKVVLEKFQNTQNKVAEQLGELEKIVLEKETVKQKTQVAAAKDSDNDDISDVEEIKIGTDPLSPDSDGDGFLDGVEVVGGFDPLNPSPTDKVVYETPEKSKAPISENYQIKKVGIVDFSLKEKRIKIEGKGIPNSFVTIYVYSQPLVLTTKVDAEGNFAYVLDKPLPEGVHRVYVAITNNQGKIKERSEVFNFLKTSTAVAAIAPPIFPEEVASPAERLYGVYTLLVVSIVILSLGLSLVIIDILLRRKRKTS